MDKKKELIVKTAVKRFCHYGFQKTTMNEIAEDLKITKANLYYYFPDKPALIQEVIRQAASQLLIKQVSILNRYNKDLLGTLNELLEVHANYLREYYMLHMNDSLEWIKGLDIQSFFHEMHQKESKMLKGLFQKAVDEGELILEDVEMASSSYLEIIKGLGLIFTISDVMSGIPDPRKVDQILLSQKNATQLIFGQRLQRKGN